MKKVLVCLAVLALTTAAFAQDAPDVAPGQSTHSMEVRGWARPGGGGSQNLIYHTGGVVIRSPRKTKRLAMVVEATLPRKLRKSASSHPLAEASRAANMLSI